MFLWNPIDVGRVAAYALVEMVNGKLTGALGESFTAANGTTYTVTEAGDGGTEIIIGPPFAFTADKHRRVEDRLLIESTFDVHSRGRQSCLPLHRLGRISIILFISFYRTLNSELLIQNNLPAE